jgi:hypothetical protein
MSEARRGLKSSSLPYTVAIATWRYSQNVYYVQGYYSEKHKLLPNYL